MKLGTFFLILHDVIERLVAMGLLTAEGDFVGPTITQDFNIARMVEEAAKARGVTVNSDVERIVNALPFFAQLVPWLNK